MQPGLFDGTAAFRMDPAGREADLTCVTPGISLAAPEEMPPPGGATAIATIHSRLQTLAKTLGENLLAAPRQLLAHRPWLPPPSAGSARSPSKKLPIEAIAHVHGRTTQSSVRIQNPERRGLQGCYHDHRKSPLLG
jgi:hypothetical protein